MTDSAADLDRIFAQIDKATEPSKMTPERAIEFLEEIADRVHMRIEALNEQGDGDDDDEGWEG